MKSICSEVSSLTGTEAVILSGLKDHCTRSMQHIKKLYDEARFLRTHLEKMEARAYYDLETFHKNPKRPSWFRRLGFLLSLVLLGGFVYREMYPWDFNAKVNAIRPYFDQIVEFIVVNGKIRNVNPTVHRLVHE